jgi:predicted KAP-like P-loop ATPase
MTKLLEKAVKKVSKLPEKEQDEMAQIILEELEDEKKWDEIFAKTQDGLIKLADEALREYKNKKTKPLDI